MIATAVVLLFYLFFADSNAVIRDYGMPIHINKIKFSPICKVKSILSKTIKFYRKMNLVCMYTLASLIKLAFYGNFFFAANLHINRMRNWECL